jgi:ribulose 1,5-bisphosphate carboxylase large subunit-like protein
MVDDKILHRYRHLVVNEIPAQRFIELRYRVTPAPHLDLRGAAIRLLLILSQRTIVPLGFEDVDKGAIETIGAVSVSPGPQGVGNITIALPQHVASRDEGLTQLVLLAASATEYSYTSELWLEDLRLPPSIMSWFSGPRLGVEGIRGRLGVDTRPLLGYTVKSRLGGSFDVMLNSCDEALAGGVDLIVDDLLCTDPDGAMAFEKRVPALCQLVERVNSNRPAGTSQAGYIVNVGSSMGKAQQYIELAASHGAFGCMVDCFTMGFGNVHELISTAGELEATKDMAFVATNMGSGMMGRNPDDERGNERLSGRRYLRTGFSEVLTAKLARLAGADAVHTGSSGTECFEVAEYSHTYGALRTGVDSLRASFAVAEGDIQFTSVAENIREMGMDVIVETASGMANHPRGISEGARAFNAILTCITDEFSREQVDELYNLLRHSLPETIDPLLEEWKQQNDARIRQGWTLEESRQALSEVDPPPGLRELLGQRARHDP